MRVCALCGVLCLMVFAGSTWAAGRDKVSWVESGSGKVLFTTDDMKRFDWNKQMFELGREAAMDLMAFDFGLHRGFEVRDQDGLIYKGEFFSPLSSQTYEGPIIMLGAPERPPLYHISIGYPDSFGKAKDQRFPPRLHDVLQKLGLLKTIDEKTPPAPIRVLQATEWVHPEKGIDLLAQAFPETFVLGKQARLHLILNKSVEGDPGFKAIKAEVALTQESKEVVRTQVLTIAPGDIGKSGYFRRTFICKFKLKGSGLRSGDASLTVRFTINRVSPDGSPEQQIIETEPITVVVSKPV